MKRIAVPAYAKINLSLDVLGRRDDGYHLLSTVFQTVALHDEVIVETAEKIELHCDHAGLAEDRGNLAYRAAEEIFAAVRNGSRAGAASGSLGAKIFLTKKIPLAAGLAGGSSDAAAVLLGLNALYGFGFTISALMQIAARIGADVPFCLLGGTAWGQGIGEKLTILPPLPPLWLVLSKPALAVSTAEVYRHYCRGDYQAKTAALLKALEQGDVSRIIDNMANELEAVTLKLYPEAAAVRRRFLAAGVLRTIMCGSGPTFLAVCRDRHHAGQVADYMREVYPETFLTCTQ